jgi:hypothetical protein
MACISVKYKKCHRKSTQKPMARGGASQVAAE